MVRVREENKLEKAEKVIQLAKKKQYKTIKKFFTEIAKKVKK